MLKNSRVFRRFLTSYLIILIIPSIAGYMSYRTSIEVTQSVSIENSVTQLEKAQEILEQRMAEVAGFTRQLGLNRELNVLMNENPGADKTNVYGIWQVMTDNMAFTQINDFLQNFYIYLKNYNVVLTQGTAYFRPEHFYLDSRYNDVTFEEWKKNILDKTHNSEITPLGDFTYKKTPQSKVITYMQSLPLGTYSSTSPAVVVVIIDEKIIANLLSGLIERYGGWTHISDAEGHTISEKGIDDKAIAKLSADSHFDKGKVSQFYGDDLVITTRSKTNGWVYRAGIPKASLMENANKIKYISWLVTGVALLIGLLAGLVLSYRNSVPINRLLSVMKDQFGKEEIVGRNEYDFLQGNIAKIITNNKRLETELNRQFPLIRDAFLKRLIAGEFQTRDETTAAASQADTGLNLNTGYVGILQIQGYSGMDSVEILNELSAARLILKQVLLDFGSHIQMTDLGADRIVTLFTISDGEAGKTLERNEIAAILEKLMQYIFYEYKITITAALGEPFSSVMEVSRSFEQARQALEYAVYVNKKGILWFSDSQMESATYYYPIDMELRLISTIRVGDIDEAKRIVLSIITQNTENRELSVEMKHQLIGELKGTLLKLLDQKAFLESTIFENVKNRIIGIQENEAIELIKREIDGIMEALCGIITSKKNDVHLKTVEQINQYISEMYGDADLNLYRIAEQVERPEKYISQLFKEVTGTNLSDHLEKVRMDHAAALLSTNQYNVDEIALRVGYNSSHSFRRAFKRVWGVSPSSYRQSVD
ncbi:AraC family transcriptional regulator [Paenibacillus psychroresistens]|uniref:AraC family transcriptional regulator n=1 Tax=Paenibacillus psychroresistens TaxID=1778678 RepID=A0A6B8RPK9_9BACL|nr:AraC family transcriptional regulator [Paenibacillus psychroresistens]